MHEEAGTLTAIDGHEHPRGQAGPHALAAATVVTGDQAVGLVTGTEVTFGRNPRARVRIGHVPLHDDLVPDLAGTVFVHRDRVVVTNTHDTLALDIRVDNRPLISVAPGDWHSPADRSFAVLVRGTLTYELAVEVHAADRTDGLDRPRVSASGARPRLSARQRRILDTYAAPLAEGNASASHQQVAETLGISRSLVRLECQRIWSELLDVGVPMRDLPDHRDAVVDAWARHRF